MSVNGLVLVTGGTGGLGHRVVERLHKVGRRVRVLSRHPRESTAGIDYVAGDLVTNRSVDAAFEGVEIVVHCAGVGKVREDTLQAQNLVSAAKPAGVKHLVSISVVGADRVAVKSRTDKAMFGYFASQRAKEEVVAASGLPWTNLRATQFHDGFILLMVRGMSKLPIVPVPSGFRFQPVDADEVADNLIELALGEARGLAPDIAGPRIYDADYLLRSYLNVIGKRRPILHVKVPGASAAAVRNGAILNPDRAVGKRTWEDFLSTISLAPAVARI